MTAVEFGKQNQNVVMLLHGGGLRHGDLSINHPERYGNILKEWAQPR